MPGMREESRMANDEHLSILKNGIESWNRWRNEHEGVLPDLSEAILTEIDLSMGDFRETNFDKAVLGNVNLRGANLRSANLCEADLVIANLREADLRDANLVKSNLTLANLTYAILDNANLTLAKLWGAQISGWSIKGVICEWAYWDKEGKHLTKYKQGEFEKLHAERPVVAMHYDGGISPIEIITLPETITKLEMRHPGCALRLRSIIQGTVEMEVDLSGDVDLEQLKQDWKRMQDSQRSVLGI
jgi:hypothetical protein